MVRKFQSYGRRTFASLSMYNYRLYMSGQVVSQIGTWIYLVAQTWLVLQLTHSPTMVGLLTATQFLPVLLLGAYGGVVADRFSKRRLLYITQSFLLLAALLMAGLMHAGLLSVWMVFAIAAVTGLVAVIDNPARQTFVVEMVGAQHLRSAVSLNSIVNNMARVVGPAIAALLIVHVGTAVCFLLNALSFGATLACLSLMRRRELQPAERAQAMRGQLSAGWRYVCRTPELRMILVMVAILGAFSFNFPIILPVLSEIVFQAGAGGYALLSSVLSLGAVAGGLAVAGRKTATLEVLPQAALLFGASTLLAAAMPSLYSTAAVLFAVGFMSTGFVAIANSTLQLRSKPAMRGRVMALWTVATIGTAPLGGPVVGVLMQQAGPRAGIVLAGLAAIAAGLYGWTQLRSRSTLQPAGRLAA